MNATDLALRHGRALLFFALAAGLAGLVTARAMPKAVYPEIAFPREQVVASLNGASAEAASISLTRPLEAGLAGIPGVEQVRSRTIRGAVELSLFFSPDTEMAAAHALVLARLAELREALPPGTDLNAERILPSSFPILSFNITGPYPPEQLGELALYTLRPALTGLPGAGPVVVQSSATREVQISLDPSRLAAAHTTASQVADRLRATNRVQTVARLTDKHELVLALASGELRTLDDVGAAVVAGSAEAPLRVRDLGAVAYGIAPQTSLVRPSGQPGAILNIARRVGGDALALDAAVRDRLAELAPSLPPGVRIEPVYQQAEFVAGGVASLRDAVLFGALFAVVVLALFLRDWRATLIAALSLPLTLAASLLALRAFGQTLNLMSLGGLAIAVGLVIDDAVVVIEAVHAQLERGATPEEAAREGTSELFWPVVGTSATTVVVFLPLRLLEGVAGQFFAALSISLAAAVTISLPIALGVLPALAARFLRPLGAAKRESRLAQLYARWLVSALAHPGRVALLALACAGLGVFGLWRLPTDFLPEADEGSYVIDYFAPPGASLADADALAAKVEDILRETKEVAAFSRRLGAELGPPAATLSSRGDIAVRLKHDRSRDIDEIIDEQRQQIAARVPGLRVEFAQVLADMLGDLQGSPEPLELRLLGPDPEVLRALAREVSGKLQGAKGLVDLFDGDEGCAPELTLRVDPLEAGRRGLSAGAVGDQLASDYLGEIATQLRAPDHLIDVRVRSATPPESILDTRVASGDAQVPLLSLATAEHACKQVALLRWNQRNEVHVTARLSGISLGEAVREAKQRIGGVTIPLGYQLEVGGLYEQEQASFRALAFVLVLAAIAVLLVLLFQLRSFTFSLAVLAAAPLSLAGAVAALFLSRMTLNISSMMGAILLIGLVVKNGILLLDHARWQLPEDGERPGREALRAALLEAGRARLRPIVMTTAATLAGLLPLVIGFGAGAELHRPLAIAVIGGLAFSTAATLLAVPALALLFTPRGKTGAASPPATDRSPAP